MAYLDAVGVGVKCIVEDIAAAEGLAQRLKDFGFAPGTVVSCRYASFDGGTVAIEFKGTVIALRRSDLAGIRVRVYG